MATPDGGPFRTTDQTTPRFICPFCYRTASVLAAGVCSRDNVPRVPLDNPQVIDDVRAHAQKLLERRQAREYAIVFGIGIALTLAIYYVGWRLGPLRGEFGIGSGSFRIGLIPAAIGVTVVFLVGAVYFSVFRKRSAMVILANREARGAQGADARPRPAGGADPDELRLPELLRWLGVRVEE